MVLAQNSEQSLVKKQDHRGLPQIHIGENCLLIRAADNKVLEAFRSAMNLLGSV